MAKTAEREKYDAIRRNQATMERVNQLLEADASKVLRLGEGMSQQELGGFYRSVVPGLVDRWGNVNATAAMQYYDSQRLAWQLKGNSRQSAERYAQRQLRTQVYVAKMPPKNPVQISEAIIGHGMQSFMKSGFGASQVAVQNALTRAVASYNRDTILYNSALDPAVITVQRIAEPTACGFCIGMAGLSLRTVESDGQYASNLSQVNYAVDYHNNCHCSIETLYQGDKPFRPDYYDGFQKAAEDAGYSFYDNQRPADLAYDIRKGRAEGTIPADVRNY